MDMRVVPATDWQLGEPSCEGEVLRKGHYVSPIRRRIKRVLLVQPPAFTNNIRSDMNPNVPLGIAYIASVLEHDGYEVAVLDAFIEGWDLTTRISEMKLLVGLPFHEIEDRIRTFDPDVVGITSMFTMQRINAHRIAEIAKKIDPRIVTIMGGAHPTAAPEMVMRDPSVDFVVLSEGENTITPLLKAIENGGDLASIDGICYRDDDARFVYQRKINIIDDLDSIPFPARHLLPMEKYFAAGVRHGGFSRGSRSTSLISSRGCQYLCNFCTAFKVFTRKPRLRSTENVMAELWHLKKTYGVDEVFFEDDQLLAKQRNAVELFERMAEIGIWFDTPNGISAWLLNETVIGKMKAAGCYRINLALESGNQHVLDNIINKPVRLDKVPGIVRSLRRWKIDVGMFIVVGNIGWKETETLGQISDSFRLARKLGVRPHVSYLTAYPGSEVLRIAQEKRYLDPGFTWDDLSIQKQQLSTQQWTSKQLRDHVEREQTLTAFSYLARHPSETGTKLFKAFCAGGPPSVGAHLVSWIARFLRDCFRDENGRQRFFPRIAARS